MSNLCRALDQFITYGTKFIVAGRLVDGKWESVEKEMTLVPPGYEEIFISLSEAEFRMDISSTELRQNGRGLSVTV